MANGPRVTIDIALKRFPRLPVPLIEGLSLDIAPSTVVALVGPSGVGKSSLLRLIAGIDTDFTGTVLIDGIPADKAPPAGFVFQDSRLLPWLTALDNIRAVRPAMPRAEAEALLRQVELEEYAAAFPRQLSGGMQRRVALARALAVNPDLLLLDEPFVSLDRALVLDLQKVFLQLFARQHSTVLLVTHWPEDAAILADRAILLDGRPLRIVGDFALEGRRGERSRAQIEHLTALISEQRTETTR